MGDHQDLADYGWLVRDAIARQACVRPNSLAVHDLGTGRRLTYAELEQEVRRAEGLLRSLATPGARVAILARNTLHHVTLFYACARTGLIFVPLNWRLSGPELAVLFEDCAPQIVIHDAEFETEAKAGLAACSAGHVFRLAADGDELAVAIASATPVAPGTISPLDPSALLFTSGTTGRPKGAIVTPKSAFFAGMNFGHVGELTPAHAQLCDVPVFHVVGLLVVMHATLLHGASLHLSPRFVPETTLARLADPDLAITHYFCVPQMAQALVDAPGGASADLNGLKMFNGGAPMPPELTVALLERGAIPCNGYGMTENGTILGVPLDREVARTKAGAAGVAAPAVEIRIVGPDGADLPVGEVGEMWLRGPSLTPGYWNQPEATAKAFVDGWFRTGDAARVDADGFYFIIDRYKDMYITGGENVYPAEVEGVIGALDAVADAAVVGAPDARWGECGWAFVVLWPAATLSAQDVIAACDARLARYKRPAHVRFIDALPRTASGKIQKDILRRMAAAENQTELQS